MELDLSRAQWQKSSYSGNTGNCVEVAELDGAVAVRDSKNTNGQVLSFIPSVWAKFIQSVKR